MSQRPFNHQRHYTRFPPDAGTHADIDLRVGPATTGASSATPEPFAPTIVGLIADESYQGCGLVILATDALQLGQVCRVQIGRQSPMIAEVRWRQELHPQVLRVGLMYRTP